MFPPIDEEDLLQPKDNDAVETVDSEDEGGPAAAVEDPAKAASGKNDASGDPSEQDEPELPVDAFSAPHQLVSIGSLAEDTEYRLLVTLNSRGGVVEQAELTDRLPSGEFRFKQVDDRAGYLGYLAIQPSVNPTGVAVQVVGSGTPAALATGNDGKVGLQPGDVIISFGSKTVLTPTDYYQALNNTTPGQEVELGVIRDTASLKFTAKTLARPMKVIQPLPKQETDITLRDPESFQLTLGTLERNVWREFSAQLREADWEILPGNSPSTVSFLYRLSVSDQKDLGLSGPVTVVKTYRLAKRENEDPMKFDRSYHLEMDVELRNESSEPLSVAVSIDGPTGLPDEGWWYINKIHGRSTAMFYTAGARDVIGSSAGMPYVFLGGPEIYSNAKETNGPLPLFPLDSSTEDRTLDFAGVDTQYFNVSLIPNKDPEDGPFIVSNAYARPVGNFEDLDKSFRKTVDISYRLTSLPLVLEPYKEDTPSTAYQQTFTVFAGPKEPELLDQYGLQSTVSYGWFAWFSKPLVWMLHFFYAVVGNYGIAIIMLTILVRAAMIPISRKAALNAQMMQHLQPEMKRLNEQYKNDMEKRAQAQRELFRRYNYNPAGGCLLMFVQLPIFLGLYRGLNVDIALRGQPLIPGIQWCSNLAGPDRLFVWESWLPFLTAKTGFLGPYFNILPIITVILFLIQQKLFMPPAVDEQTRMTQKMMTYMMVFMGVMFFRVPSGLCIYFITSSTWGIIERKLLPKPTLDGKLARVEAASSITLDAGPKTKSAAQSRIEEQRQRQRQKNRKKDRKNKR